MKVRCAGVVRQDKFVRRTKAAMADNPSSPQRPEEGVNVDGERFDALLREVATPMSRRRIVGGVLGGGVALVTGTAAIKAKPGNGKAKGKTKAQICHYQGTNDDGVTPKYKVLKLGAPGAQNHLKNHENDAPYVDCCPGDTCLSKGECFTTVGCDATGACAYTVNEGALCTIGGVPDAGTCAAITGECVPNPTP